MARGRVNWRQMIGWGDRPGHRDNGHWWHESRNREFPVPSIEDVCDKIFPGVSKSISQADRSVFFHNL